MRNENEIRDFIFIYPTVNCQYVLICQNKYYCTLIFIKPTKKCVVYKCVKVKYISVLGFFFFLRESVY